jgi:hypothetical protein
MNVQEKTNLHEIVATRHTDATRMPHVAEAKPSDLPPTSTPLYECVDGVAEDRVEFVKNYTFKSAKSESCKKCRFGKLKAARLGLRREVLWCRLYKRPAEYRCIDFKERP